MAVYEKYDKNEDIQVGDLISLMSPNNKAIRSVYKYWKHKNILTIGVCSKITGNEITIQDTGLIDVNVTGLVCIGDKLSISNKAGKAKAIRYENMDEDIFNIRSIGKVVKLYNDYSKVQVLLDIE